MREYKQFEQSISKQFEEYQPEIDNDMIWNAIADQVSTKKKERSFLLYFLSGLGICLLFVGAYFFMNAKPNKNQLVEDNIVFDNAELENKEINQQEETTTAIETEQSNAFKTNNKLSDRPQGPSLEKQQSFIGTTAKTNASNAENIAFDSGANIHSAKAKMVNSAPSNAYNLRATGKNIRLQPQPKNRNEVSKAKLNTVTQLERNIKTLAPMSLVISDQDPLLWSSKKVLIDYPEKLELALPLDTKRPMIAHSIGAQLSYLLPSIRYSNNANTEAGYDQLRAENEQSLEAIQGQVFYSINIGSCLLYTSPSPRDQRGSRMPSSA